ncbi:eCIS core domain-containing protein [Leptolyngbya sp. GGD]|uniref:eCIS core domain-containing protein n=1 Tax=Leptolyngbya sp. GGD TaxID=2997907 RepID=UPI002279FEF3|nr:DUF4157 domain-containing protein [Leptolyngbya sp. GGD]MCY6493371.1 DUF4157 domain-containing protein [Leptolyngbya sp. GGD]
MRSRLKSQTAPQSSFISTENRLLQNLGTHQHNIAIDAPPVLHEALSLAVRSTNNLIIQPKLTIGAVNDKYEQEADRIAAQVVNQINAPQSLQRGEAIQRQENNEDDKLQMKPLLHSPLEGIPATLELEAEIEHIRGSGQPLAESIRRPMEQAFGADFSGVRVHTDSKSNRLNTSIQSSAFTTGQDVFFRQGAYEPGRQGGLKLLAHELTHVVQQRGGGELLGEPRTKHRVSGTGSKRVQRKLVESATWPLSSTAQTLVTQLHSLVPKAENLARISMQLYYQGKQKPTAHQFNFKAKAEAGKTGAKEWGYCIEEQLDSLVGHQWSKQVPLGKSRPDYTAYLPGSDIIFVDLTTPKEAGSGGDHITKKLYDSQVAAGPDWRAADITHSGVVYGGTGTGPMRSSAASKEEMAVFQAYRAAARGKSDVDFNDGIEALIQKYGKKVSEYTFDQAWDSVKRAKFLKIYKDALHANEREEEYE